MRGQGSWPHPARLFGPWLLVSALVLLVGRPIQAAEANGVTREVFGNLGGSALSDLTNHASFPSNPTLESIQPSFEAPTDWAENYGTRMSALLIPPVTGSYTFWIASDDQSALFLSTDETPTQRQQICGVQAWTASREWTKEPNQQSAPITLTAGRRYYIEALQKEGDVYKRQL